MGGLVSAEEFQAVDDGHRRARILLALGTCMTEKGYRDTTISDIARVARVSKTVVYAHFHDKEECLLELVTRATDKVLEQLRRTAEDAIASDLPWQERLRTTVGALLGALASAPDLAWACLVEVQTAGRSGRTLRREILDRYVALITETAHDLARREPEHVRRIDRDLVVAAVGGIHELMLARVERGEAARLAEETDSAAQLLIDLLQRRP